MTERINNGGPAFPLPDMADRGLSKRDCFAAHAHVTITDAEAALRDDGIDNPSMSMILNVVAEFKYRIADAMLRERDKGVSND